MEHRARFQFFGRLQNLLVRPHEAGRLSYVFKANPAVKDAIEALGLPHTEVAAIGMNGRSVTFADPLQDGARVDVYPHGWMVSLTPLCPLTPPLPGEPHFILDVHLGKLARRLRMLGFDCLYRNDFTDFEIVDIARRESRIVLSRDRGLLKRKLVVWGCLLDAEYFPEQLREVDARYGLLERLRPLVRCPVCNGLLEPVDKAEILDRLEPKTIRYYNRFRRCPGCDRIYWRGSQAERLLRWIESVRADSR